VERPKPEADWVKLSGLGIELAAAVAGLTLFGYWLDRHFGTGPWGMVVGGTVGIVGGLYNLIRQSLIAVQNAGREDGKSDGGKE
jgi:F0F1-type ATP synthase assembly protein I